MDRLEEELLAGFDEDGEFTGPWLKRPADLDKLVKSQNTRVREVVASIGLAVIRILMSWSMIQKETSASKWQNGAVRRTWTCW